MYYIYGIRRSPSTSLLCYGRPCCLENTTHRHTHTHTTHTHKHFCGEAAHVRSALHCDHSSNATRRIAVRPLEQRTAIATRTNTVVAGIYIRNEEVKHWTRPCTISPVYGGIDRTTTTETRVRAASNRSFVRPKFDWRTNLNTLQRRAAREQRAAGGTNSEQHTHTSTHAQPQQRHVDVCALVARLRRVRALPAARTPVVGVSPIHKVAYSV